MEDTYNLESRKETSPLLGLVPGSVLSSISLWAGSLKLSGVQGAKCRMKAIKKPLDREGKAHWE